VSEDEERSGHGRRWLWGGAIVALILAGISAAIWWAPRTSGVITEAREVFASGARAPEGVRIRVEILNATAVARLALAATPVLRDRGFDVVSVGNAPARRDSTLVLDRRGHPEWARLVMEVLGGARVESRPDTSSYVDITVLLGADWTPPPKTVYP